MIGLLLRGEHIAVIDVEPLRLTAAATWAIGGTDIDPLGWSYGLSFPTPSGNERKRAVMGTGVVHCRLASDIEPHVGVSPLSGLIEGRMLATLATRLNQESQAPVGSLLHVAGLEGANADTVQAFRTQLGALKGGVNLAPTNTSLTDSRDANTAGNAFAMTRIGAHPPESVLALRTQAVESVYAALGLKASLFERTTDGQSLREAARLAGLRLESYARLVAGELSAKFEFPVTLDLHEAWLADLRTRSQVARALADAQEKMGLTPEQIQRASGFR